LEAKTRLKPIPPDTAAFHEEEEGAGHGLLDLLWLEPIMCWDGTSVVFLRGERELIFE
jgi:hypothetical protein